LARTRSYAKEYEARVARGLARGLSRSQSRGHARAGEIDARAKASPLKSDDRLEEALRQMRATGSQSHAAKVAKVSPERFRRFVRENSLAQRKGRIWEFADQRPRDVVIFSDADQFWVRVRGFDDASAVMLHAAAVRAFAHNATIANAERLLSPFKGQGVTDINGQFHLFEVRPNRLLETLNTSPGFETIYRLVQ
jgi:hypothetical protein